MHRAAAAQQLCMECVLGLEGARSLAETLSRSQQLPLGFELTRNGYLLFPPRVEIVDFTPQVLKMLAENPEEISRLRPERFEKLIGNRLEALGFEVIPVGKGTFHKDGGIDFVALPRSSPMPFLMAVQARHVTHQNRKIGPAPLRELLGSVQTHGFNAGLLVTNTSFTPDALWLAQQRAILLRLGDIDDLRRWLRDEALRDAVWRGIPTEIEICPGVIVQIPREKEAG